MILTKQDIEAAQKSGDIEISPFDPKQLGPNSYDLRLGPNFMMYKDFELDARKELKVVGGTMPAQGLKLLPGTLYLMHTIEKTSTSKFVPMIEGRSSVGRLGIFVHATAGFGDIGFSGSWTLEVSVVQPVIIYAGMRICQIYFHQCVSAVDKQDMYQGKYTEQRDLPKPSSIWKERDEWLIEQ
jgi:dCTP deaminase